MGGGDMQLPFRKTNSKDRVLGRVQDAVDRSITAIMRCPILDGVLVSANLIQGSDTVVSHCLGRKPVGWFIVGTTRPANVYESTAVTTADPAKQIAFRTSITGPFTFWIF